MAPAGSRHKDCAVTSFAKRPYASWRSTALPRRLDAVFVDLLPVSTIGVPFQLMIALPPEFSWRTPVFSPFLSAPSHSLRENRLRVGDKVASCESW